MDVALQILSNILIPGAIFALVTIGFSLIYSVTRILHVAHGGVVITAGYAFFAALSLWQWPVWAAIVFALGIALALNLVVNEFIYERLRDRTAISVAGALIATLSALLIIENVNLAFFGSATKSFPKLSGALHEFGPVIFSDHELRILTIAPILLLALFLFLARTRSGKALRAVADHESVAEVVGISSKKMRRLAFGIGSFLAGAAGILFAIEYNLEPSMSTMVAIRMFFRAILGGVGSVGGAVVGSLVLETGSALTSWFWNSGWIDFTMFVITCLVLLFRPQGLFGKSKRSV